MEKWKYFQLSQSDQTETSDLKLRKQAAAAGETSCGYLVDTEWEPQYDQPPPPPAARPKSALDGARSL